MKVKFEYRISGQTENATGEVTGEGEDYEATMQDAYNSLCNQIHNQFLTITFKKIS